MELKWLIFAHVEDAERSFKRYRLISMGQQQWQEKGNKEDEEEDLR